MRRFPKAELAPLSDPFAPAQVQEFMFAIATLASRRQSRHGQATARHGKRMLARPAVQKAVTAEGTQIA